MNNHNITLQDIARVGKSIADDYRDRRLGSEKAGRLMAETALYTFGVRLVFPEADRQWLLPEVRQAVVDLVVYYLDFRD